MVIADLNVEDGEALQKELGERASFHKTDVSNLAELEDLMQGTADTFGGLDVLVNNAGIACIGFTTPELDPAVWQKVISVDLDAVFYGPGRG